MLQGGYRRLHGLPDARKINMLHAEGTLETLYAAAHTCLPSLFITNPIALAESVANRHLYPVFQASQLDILVTPELLISLSSS